MKNIKFIFVVILALHSLVVFADNETILVSDIDDTIKVSHVLDPDSAIGNAINTKNVFMGMSDVYRALQKEKTADAFVYLSNAPRFLMKGFHTKFLKRNLFPDGTLLLVKGIRAKTHKLDSLRKLIKDKKPKLLILIGDNGEKDIAVYAQIQKEHPETDMITFIHVVYSEIGHEKNIGKRLEENQIAFATSLELAGELHTRGLISESSYNDLLFTIIPVALKESNFVERSLPMMFPDWLDCRDFKTITLPVSTPENADLVTAFEKRLNDRCDVSPFGN